MKYSIPTFWNYHACVRNSLLCWQVNKWEKFRRKINLRNFTILRLIINYWWGNKCDLESEREVQASTGQQQASSWECPFFETSAKTKQNAEEAFFSNDHFPGVIFPRVRCCKGDKSAIELGTGQWREEVKGNPPRVFIKRWEVLYPSVKTRSRMFYSRFLTIRIATPIISLNYVSARR